MKNSIIFLIIVIFSCASPYGKTASTDKQDATSSLPAMGYAEKITWKNGWGLLLCVSWQDEIKFDRISFFEEKGNNLPQTHSTPFSFKFTTSESSHIQTKDPRENSCLIIIPLNETPLSKEDYPLFVFLEKRTTKGKKGDEYFPILHTKVNYSVVENLPPDLPTPQTTKLQLSEQNALTQSNNHFSLNLKSNASYDLDESFEDYKNSFSIDDERLDATYSCFQKDQYLQITINVQNDKKNKIKIGNLYSPVLKGDESRKHTALDRLKITLKTNGKTKTTYIPLPVFFLLNPGDICSFSFCLKNADCIPNASEIHIEHLLNPEGTYGNLSSPEVKAKLIFKYNENGKP